MMAFAFKRLPDFDVCILEAFRRSVLDQRLEESEEFNSIARSDGESLATRMRCRGAEHLRDKVTSGREFSVASGGKISVTSGGEIFIFVVVSSETSKATDYLVTSLFQFSEVELNKSVYTAASVVCYWTGAMIQTETPITDGQTKRPTNQGIDGPMWCVETRVRD